MRKEKEAKNYVQALTELKCAYTNKNHFSLEMDKAILDIF